MNLLLLGTAEGNEKENKERGRRRKAERRKEIKEEREEGQTDRKKEQRKSKTRRKNEKRPEKIKRSKGKIQKREGIRKLLRRRRKVEEEETRQEKLITRFPFVRKLCVTMRYSQNTIQPFIILVLTRYPSFATQQIPYPARQASQVNVLYGRSFAQTHPCLRGSNGLFPCNVRSF